MEHRKVAKRILTTAGLVTMISPWIADMGRTHMRNPRWPPHAKQHDAQTIALGTVLGAASVYFVHRRTGDWRTNLAASGTLGAAFWIGQAASILFPGTAPADPDSGGDGRVAGIPGQLIADAVMVPLVALACLIGAQDEES